MMRWNGSFVPIDDQDVDTSCRCLNDLEVVLEISMVKEAEVSVRDRFGLLLTSDLWSPEVSRNAPPVVLVASGEFVSVSIIMEWLES